MKEEKELNLVEILKDAPRGTKLYSPLFGECELIKVEDSEILVNAGRGYFYFSEKGRVYKDCGECLLFQSKENRDWSTFRGCEKGFQVGDHVKERNSDNVSKIKGIFGSKTRADEVLEWLKSQGAVKCGYTGDSEINIYYVDNGEVKLVDEIHSILFDIVELPRWRAEKDEKYYYVSDTVSISATEDSRWGRDDKRYEIGNYFKTKEEAESYAEKICEIFKAKS